MQANIIKIEPGKLQLTVELEKQELGIYVRNARADLGKDIVADGFRKGKAPLDMLKNHIPEEQVLQTALQTALQASLAQAIQENALDVVKTADLKIKDNTSSKLSYSIILFVFPRLQLPDLNEISVRQLDVRVSDKEIDDAINTIRNMRATFSEKNSTAAAGDRLEVDFNVSMNGKTIEGGESKNHPLIIGGREFIPGFEEQLIGLGAGQEKKFTLAAPADYYHKAVAGKALDFAVKINKVQTVHKPELNDELAQQIGKFNDLAQLRANMRQGILQEKTEREQQRMRLEILDKIIDTANIEAPDFLIQEQLELMIAGFDGDLHAKGMELGMYLAHIGKTADDLRKDWRKNAKRQAKIALVLHQIINDKKMEVSNEELERATGEMVQMLISRGQADPSNINLKDIRDKIAVQLLNEKALGYLEQAVTKA